MPNITFSHAYPKLHDQTEATLLTVEIVHRKDLHADFIEYDTKYYAGPHGAMETKYFPLNPGEYILMVFLGDKNIPFTTVRPYTKDKFFYYLNWRGKQFTVVIKEGDDAVD